jgi:hypothetical protein
MSLPRLLFNHDETLKLRSGEEQASAENTTGDREARVGILLREPREYAGRQDGISETRRGNEQDSCCRCHCNHLVQGDDFFQAQLNQPGWGVVHSRHILCADAADSSLLQLGRASIALKVGPSVNRCLAGSTDQVGAIRRPSIVSPRQVAVAGR